MRKDKLYAPRIWFGILALVGTGIYAIGISIPYYGDDYQLAFDLSPRWSFGSFYAQNVPENGFYRPIQNSVLWSIQQLFGLNTIPSHIIQLSMHVSLSWLVFLFMRDLNIPVKMAAYGSLAMVSAQTNAAAVLGNDTMSQVMSALFGYLALYLIFHSHINGRAVPLKPMLGRSGYVLAVTSLALALLSKESGISFLLMVVGIISIVSFREDYPLAPLKILQRSLPFILVTGAFLIVRANVVDMQPTFGTGYYEFAIGTNMLRNLALFVSGIVLPVSSAMVFVAIKNGTTSIIVGTIAMTAIFLAMVVRGLWSSRELYRPMILSALFFVVALFPVVMLNHVSELYTYNAMPLASVVIGVGIGKCLELRWKSRMMKMLINGFILLLLISNIVALQSKALLMRENGERSDRLIGQILPFLKNVPVDGTLILMNPCDEQPEYSIFRMKGFNVFQWGLHRLPQLAGRKDFKVEIIEECRIPEESIDGRSLFLSLGPQGVRETMVQQPGAEQH